MEVQAHGNRYEDIVTRQRTQLSKQEYDNLKSQGYTSAFDLVRGLVVNYDGSIKTTGNNSICCSDIIRMMQHKDYRLIVGCYTQKGDTKVFHTEYEFIITPEDYDILWGDMSITQVGSFVDYVKSIPAGREAQQQTKLIREELKQEVSSDTALFVINPKVDSKKQRRVQCSIKLDKLLASGVKYTQRPLSLTISSSRREFNK